MDIETPIEPVTALKTQAAKLIRRVRRTTRPIVITQNGKASAVLQDMYSFERQRNTIALLKLLTQGDEAYRQGRSVDHADVKRRFTKKLKRLSRSDAESF